jgi:O-antigen ligase
MKPLLAQKPLHYKFLNTVRILLLLILFIKISGFFTWSENVAITRVFKVFSRIMMTVAIFFVYRKIIDKGAVDSSAWSNVISPLLYTGYLLLGFASFLWSTNPGYSALQWVMDIESYVFAYYFIKCFLLLEEFFPNSGVHYHRILAQAILMIMLIFLVGVIVAPDVFYRMTHGGEEARLGGWMMNPNELGMICVVGISCFIFDLYDKKQKFWTLFQILLLLIALILTSSRSSMIGFMLIVFFHVAQSKNPLLKVAIVTGAILAVPVIVQTIFLKQGDLEEVMSMTGRLPFWTALLTEGLPREPWLGFGFMRINYTETFQGVHTYAGHMTHNTFIQVLMNLGFIGFTLVMIQFGFTIKGFLSTKEKRKKLMLIGIFIPVVINSFTEFGIFGETNYGILFYQLMVFMISLSHNPLLTLREKVYLKKRRPELELH